MTNSNDFVNYSASLSGGNLVDGLPRALHNTDAVGVSHGGFGPAPICKLDPRKLRFEEKCCEKLPESFVHVLV